MGAVSVGLLCAGIWFLLSSVERSREQKEQDYLQAIQHWEQARIDFRGLKVTASTRYGHVSLKEYTTPDALHDSENAVELPNYEHLSYLATGVPRGFLPVGDFGSLQGHDNGGKTPAAGVPHMGKQRPLAEEWGPVVSVALQLEDSSGFGGAILETVSFPVVLALVRHAPTPAPELKCRRELQGYYKGGRCWVYSKLVGLCVQVRKDALSRKWRFSPGVEGRNESYGCDYSYGKWTVPRYEKVPASHANGFVSFENITIQVRSAEDPYIRALNLTNGALDFGMTAQDDRAVGLVMLLLGMVISCPPCFKFYKAYGKHNQTAREMHYRQSPRDQYGDDDDSGEMYGSGGYTGWETDPNEMRSWR